MQFTDVVLFNYNPPVNNWKNQNWLVPGGNHSATMHFFIKKEQSDPVVRPTRRRSSSAKPDPLIIIKWRIDGT